jgi:hypothetical protein
VKVWSRKTGKWKEEVNKKKEKIDGTEKGTKN